MDKRQRSQNVDLIYGIRPVIEALMKIRILIRFYCKKVLWSEIFRELFQLIRQHHIPFQYVPVERLNRYTKGNHQELYVSCPLSFIKVFMILFLKFMRKVKRLFYCI